MSRRSYDQVAARLHGDAERLFSQGQHPAAERKVRQLLSLQQRVVGRRHPDFALGLCMLGELRFHQGDPAGAEAYFRRALAIRGRVLGHQHPDYAVSLVCLGSVLWRRGEVEEAERRYREALAIRYEVLGEHHPDSVQSRKELARLLRRRGDWAGAQALSLDANEVVRGGDPARADLGAEIVVLSADFARLGEKLASAARRMGSPGMPPPSECVEELTGCRRSYDRLCNETLRRIEGLQVPGPSPKMLGTLQDLAALLDDLGEAEILQSVHEEVRRRAIGVLERVLSLDYARDEEFPPLRECQEHARQLLETIEAEHWSELPAQAETLAEGTHALVGLLTLVEYREALTDREWAELHEEVGNTLGAAIASAASRARLVIVDEPDDPSATESSVTSTSQPPSMEPPLQPAPALAEVEHDRAPAAQPAPPRVVEPAPTASTRPAPRPARRRPATPAETAAATLDPHVALMRDLAVASLVPTMGKVINLPTASPSEREIHRLLRVGQAPNVVEWTPAADPGHDRRSHRPHRPASELARRYATYHRIGRGVIAGPLALTPPADQPSAEELFGPDLPLMLEEEQGRSW